MQSLKKNLTIIVANAFEALGYDRKFGEVTLSQRPELGQFQCNGALPLAKIVKQSPHQIAEQIISHLKANPIFSSVSMAGAGFINLSVTDKELANHVQRMADAERWIEPSDPPLNVVADYGGPNVAKPMHVGHLRASIIGESLKRISRFFGHRTWGDVHLGDWGTQMGMLITEMALRQPDLPYFDPNYTGPYPAESPITLDQLEEMYPQANQRCQADPTQMESARLATVDLQQKRPGYYALWRHFVDISVAQLKRDFSQLQVEFDLWLGESDVQAEIPDLIAQFKSDGHAIESDGAWVIPIAKAGDKKEIPPMLLVKSDGAVLYATTDIATIWARMRDLQTDLVLYVVDARQGDHFEQVFRSAYKTQIAPPTTQLEHVAFGTVNGKDGKPFKTRAGGVMRLQDLLELITQKALERMQEAEVAKDYPEAERLEIARKVGLSAVKFGDLSNHRTKNYVFDLDRFSSFEGYTGPYLLYTAVRAKSILRKADARHLNAGPIIPPSTPEERELMLQLGNFTDAVAYAFETRAPNHLCEYAYQIALAFNRFYKCCHILRAETDQQQAGWLSLTRLTMNVLVQLLDLLGIAVPERM